ncbi:MAG: hypothetical protein M3Z57_05250 [Candidatus Dormibacteraeota bacterium]|nr:hypothetical protein [Candidatus Dormibacteraeota bacterium]
MSEKPYTEADAAAERDYLRHCSPDVLIDWSRPELEPLATRLARTNELETCRSMTSEMLEKFRAEWPCLVTPNVRMGKSFPAPEQSGCDVESLTIAVDFLVVTWHGVFLIWSWPDRFMADAYPEALRARAQLQEDLGEEWPGTVEAVFHFPREQTGWGRNVGVDEETDEPFAIVFVSGRIDALLAQWEGTGKAAGEGMHASGDAQHRADEIVRGVRRPSAEVVGIDPQWLRWLSQASQPRWWELATTRRLPPMPEMHPGEEC